MRDLWEYLKGVNKPILLYGMGNGAELIIENAAKKQVHIDGIFASEGFLRNQLFHGFRVMSLLQAERQFGDFCALVAFGSSLESVIEKVTDLSKRHELYSVDVPVYGNRLFDADYYYENKFKFSDIKNCFADEKSKATFDSIIRFKLGGKLCDLFDAESPRCDEKQILNLTDAEKYYDLGAYTGDTVKTFVDSVGGYSSVTAVEPDKRNFAKLLTNTGSMRNIRYVNAAASYLNGSIQFCGLGGRNACVGENNIKVDSVTVDTLCKEFGPPSFIKFDVEGEELNALIGCENTIKNHRPKMLISAYHRTEDLLSIPEKVLSLYPDYKVYIRHFRYIPCWDTNYYFV